MQWIRGVRCHAVNTVSLTQHPLWPKKRQVPVGHRGTADIVHTADTHDCFKNVNSIDNVSNVRKVRNMHDVVTARFAGRGDIGDIVDTVFIASIVRTVEILGNGLNSGDTVWSVGSLASGPNIKSSCS